MKEERPRDPAVTVNEPFEMVNFNKDPAVRHNVFISSFLMAEERKALIELLEEFEDVSS